MALENCSEDHRVSVRDAIDDTIIEGQSFDIKPLKTRCRMIALKASVISKVEGKLHVLTQMQNKSCVYLTEWYTYE